MSARSHEESRPQPRLRSSNIPLQHVDLIVLAGMMALLPGLLFVPLPWLRIPFGIFAVLAAPGYALTAALFPAREDLDGVARAALSVGLSVALIPPLALLLDWLPWGIRPMPIAVALGLTTCSLCLVAGVRRYLSADPYTLLPPAAPAPRRLSRSHLAAIGAVLLVVIWGAVVYTAILTTPTRITEFYALGAGGLAEDYPREVAAGEPVSVTLGITNQEGATHSYQIEIRADTGTLATVGPLQLDNGTTWSQPVTFSLPVAGDDQAVDILLFRDDQPEPYRRLRLWMNVRGLP
jgi:uncharacterized membrane protein